MYVRLWTQLSNAWSYNDYTYTAVSIPIKAVLTAPTGTTLGGSTVTFTWTAGNGATAYWLDIGTGQGLGNLFAANTALATKPDCHGTADYRGCRHMRPRTQVNGVWSYNDYSFTANLSVKAVMNSPAGGSTLPGASVTFTWATGAGASAYWLDVGTAQGMGNLFAANLGLVTSRTVSSLPTTGIPIYVRLWTQISGVWSYTDYTYTAATLP